MAGSPRSSLLRRCSRPRWTGARTTSGGSSTASSTSTSSQRAPPTSTTSSRSGTRYSRCGRSRRCGLASSGGATAVRTLREHQPPPATEVVGRQKGPLHPKVAEVVGSLAKRMGMEQPRTPPVNPRRPKTPPPPPTATLCPRCRQKTLLRTKQCPKGLCHCELPEPSPGRMPHIEAEEQQT